MSDDFADEPTNPTLDSTGTAEEPAKRPAWFWWAVAAAIVVALAALFFFLRTPTVAAPQTVGLSQADAETTITAAGLTVGEVSEVGTLAVEPGTVLDQSPAAEERVPEGSRIDLTVAALPVIAVPDVVGQSLSGANEMIASEMLRSGEVEHVFDEQVEAGLVISQEPESGTEVPVATAVDLTVSKGKQQNQVPNVVGLPASDAEDALKAAEFATKQIKAESTTIPAGDVMEQSPAAGTITDPGSTVTLTVSTGAPEPPVASAPPASPAETTPPTDSNEAETPTEPETPTVPESPATPPSTLASVPDVIGMGILDAIRALKDVSLKVGFAWGPSEEDLLKIIAQDPAAGTEVDRGSVVTVTIGLPPFLFGEADPPPVPTTLPSTEESGQSEIATSAP